MYVYMYTYSTYIYIYIYTYDMYMYIYIYIYICRNYSTILEAAVVALKWLGENGPSEKCRGKPDITMILAILITIMII